METAIEEVRAWIAFDSRGNPTVAAEVVLRNGVCGSAMVPSGASTGKYEALELRDKEKAFKGKGVFTAIKNIYQTIAPALKGKNALEQFQIDSLLLQLDGTENKSRLGANAILAVSLACAKAAATSQNMPLYQYLAGKYPISLPIPMFNILNGGVHADNPITIQEFMIVPHPKECWENYSGAWGFTPFERIMQVATEIYHTLKEVLKEKKYATNVGDEGGFAPQVANSEEALKLLLDAIHKAGYKPYEEVSIALDAAASEFYNPETQRYQLDQQELTPQELIDLWERWCEQYPIVSIEDALAEDDWENWQLLTKRLGSKVQLVGDDLFVTNPKRIQQGIEQQVANAVLIKPNQIGTLSETIESVLLAQRNGYNCIISHRSGETEDTTIADLAVALNTGQIKTGAPARSDRVAKYNRLLAISYHHLFQQFPGASERSLYEAQPLPIGQTIKKYLRI